MGGYGQKLHRKARMDEFQAVSLVGISILIRLQMDLRVQD